VTSTLKWLVVLVGIGFAVAPRAADPASLEEQIQIVRSSTEIERQSTLIRGAQLEDAELERFAPVYQDYRREVTAVNDKLLALLKSYADQYTTLTDAQAQALTRDSLALERDRVDLKIRYAKRFGKVLPARKVARVMQIENRMDLLQMIGAATTIPLAKP
jgi:hypothetical protein